MKKLLSNLFIIAVLLFLYSCDGSSSKNEASVVSQLILKNSEFGEQIQTLKAQQDTTKDIDRVFAIDDQIAKIKDSANIALQSILNGKREALAFKQIENTEKIVIDSLFISGVGYDVFTIEAKITAIESSVFDMVYTSLSAMDSAGKKIEIAGGIGIDTKLTAGEKYIFKGEIREIGKLKGFTSIVFDESIKKW